MVRSQMARSEKVSAHKDILNHLVEMQESNVYASRKSTLLCAEELIYKMEQEINCLKADFSRLQSRIDSAPIAIMDTREALGICAPAEGDFPALYALQGKRVKLVVFDGADDHDNEIFKQLSDLPSDHAFWKNEWMFTHSVFMQESRQMNDKVEFWKWFKTLPVDLKRFVNCVAHLK